MTNEQLQALADTIHERAKETEKLALLYNASYITQDFILDAAHHLRQAAHALNQAAEALENPKLPTPM